MGTQNKPLVSVVIPTYGRSDKLYFAVESILAQDYANLEIIVVNDNPKDSENYLLTMAVLNKYSNNLKVKVLSDGVNRGGSFARNQGIEVSNGEYITFLDDDDFFYKNKISEQLAHIIKYDLDISVCDMDVCKDDKILPSTNKSIAVGAKINDFLLHGNIYTPMIFCKRKCLEEVGMFTDTPRFQDHVLILKFLIGNFKIGELRKKLFVHNEHNGERISISNKKKNIEAYYIRRKYENDLVRNLNQQEKMDFELNRFYQDIFFLDKGFKFFIKNFFKYTFKIKNIKGLKFLFKIAFKFFLRV